MEAADATIIVKSGGDTWFQKCGYMGAKDILRNNWPAITITVTAAAVACAAIVTLRSMPPRMIVMATGPEGGTYYEVGERYRVALARAGVDLRLLRTNRARTVASSDTVYLLTLAVAPKNQTRDRDRKYRPQHVFTGLRDANTLSPRRTIQIFISALCAMH
jgi:hypothetical protein